MFHIAGGILLAIFILYVFLKGGWFVRTIALIGGAFCVNHILGAVVLGIALVVAIIALATVAISAGSSAFASTRIGGAVSSGLAFLFVALGACSVLGMGVFYFLDRAKASDWLIAIAPDGWLLAALPLMGALPLGVLWLIVGRYDPLARDSAPAVPPTSAPSLDRIEPRLVSRRIGSDSATAADWPVAKKDDEAK